MFATQTPSWYALDEPDLVDSPALLVYPERVARNIAGLLETAGGAERLRPHVKTHKMPQIVHMHRQAGIHKFKCATIAEAEMLAGCGAADILLAYQPTGPKIGRLLALAAAYPHLRFSCLTDNEATLRQISAAAAAAGQTLPVWLDVDSGMARTGISPGDEAAALYRLLADLPGVTPGGLHVYDGHLRQPAIADRQAASNAAFAAVDAFIEQLAQEDLPVPAVVAGGSPSFPTHAGRPHVELSPGTYVFWDIEYGQICPELPFQPAAVVLTRVISKTRSGQLCLDLGHKAIASENPLDRRVRFLGFEPDEVTFAGHSEEHLVVEVADPDRHQVGEVWYGLPWHVCPTVALHQEAVVVDNGRVQDRWPVVARDRRLRF